VEANGVGGRNDSTGDDVVAIHQGAGNRFPNPVARSNKQPCFTG
jgi:hypothetical protein